MPRAWGSASADASPMKHPALVRGIRARVHRLGPATKYLGITPQELRSELRAGKSLAQIARAHGKTVEGLVDAVVAPARARLDAAVANGHLTRQRADEILGCGSIGGVQCAETEPCVASALQRGKPQRRVTRVLASGAALRRRSRRL